MSQEQLTLEKTLLECKRWHQGDKWRDGTPEQRECWSKQMANIDTALAALSATQPAHGMALVPDNTLTPLQRTYLTQAQPAQGANLPYAWAVSGIARLFTGPHAEYDARLEANHCGGTAEAFPLFKEAQAAQGEPVQVVPLQERVRPWLMACFGPMIAGDREERNHRFLEEALELVQACGCTSSEAHQLVDYTFGRPLGEKNQEVGGVMITLAALCLANGLDMHAAGETELARIWTMVEKIRAKQAAKPKHSPLPQHVDTQPAAGADVLDAGQVIAWLETGEWRIQKVIPSEYLTDEANAERAWMVERQTAPFEGKEGERVWFGETAHKAMSKARAAIAASGRQS